MSNKIAANLTRYIKSFSPKTREIIECFGFEADITKLKEADIPIAGSENDLHVEVM